MTYWPWYLGALALATIALAHWLVIGRLMSVSSRFTGIVDRLRGGGGVHAGAAGDPVPSHLSFFGGVAAGALLASIIAGSFEITVHPGARFAALFGSSPITTALVLGLGGVLVGAGTRMAKGCTSGHGLCGVARFEKGSLVATTAFFGTGVIVSIVIGWVLG